MKGSGLTPFVLYDNNWLLVHPAIVDWSPAPALLAGEMAFVLGNDVPFLPSIDSLSKEKIILFVDLEGFTRLSETLKLQQITDLLNECFSTVVAIIERHRGVVTQFQGDAILGIFNVPVSDSDHVGNAVKAAKQMYVAVSQREFAGHQFAIRVGVNTGEVFAGNVGARDRLSYTVHGDAVNMAACLEAMNKEFGTRILIGGSTAALVSDVSLRQISGATIRGKIEAVQVFEVCLEP